MNKQEFLDALRKGLSALPREEAEEHLTFYREMIDDRIEDGLTEAEAVREIGTPEEILSRIPADTPSAQAGRESSVPKDRVRWWGILLLILGSPIWLSLLIAVFAVVLSLYAVLWSAIVSLWAVEVSLWGTAFGTVVGGAGMAIFGHPLPGLAMIGAGLVCAGLSVFLFFGCTAAVRGSLVLARMMCTGMKRLLIKKEAA